MAVRAETYGRDEGPARLGFLGAAAALREDVAR